MKIEIKQYRNGWGYTIYERDDEVYSSQVNFKTEKAAQKAALKEKIDIIKTRAFSKYI
jgi:hypothetical protein